MANSDPGDAVASIAIAERRARTQLREAEAAGAHQLVIDDLTRSWRDLIATLLRVYAAPGNWRQDLPCGVIPKDTAEALSARFAIDQHETATSQTLLLPIADLLPALAAAREDFRRGQNDGGHKAAGSALKAVVRCMEAANPEMKEMLEPLHYLAATLDDYAAGRRIPMLPARKRTRRGPLPAQSNWWLLKEVVAIAVEILLDDDGFHPGWGRREDAANKYVARRLKRIGLQCDSTTVGNWRSEVRAYLASDDLSTGERPDLTKCDEHTRTYLHIKYEWQASKADIPAKKWVDDLIGDSLRPIAAHPPKKVG